MTEWATNVVSSVGPQIESVQALAVLAANVPPTVLIVDDDEFQRNLMGALLQPEGDAVRFAASGSEALSVVSRVTPDVILLDVQMPDIDGVDVIRRLKKNARLRGVPVIMITGNAERLVVHTSQRLGASDFLVKPVSRTALLERLRRVLRTNTGTATAPSSSAGLASETSPVPHAKLGDAGDWVPGSA